MISSKAKAAIRHAIEALEVAYDTLNTGESDLDTYAKEALREVSKSISVMEWLIR